MFRFYGPEKPLFDKTWKLGDIEIEEVKVISAFTAGPKRPSTKTKPANLQKRLLGATAAWPLGRGRSTWRIGVAYRFFLKS